MDTLDTTTGEGLRPGRKIGRYTIVRALGSGGMGAVYEAVHDDLEKRVALKTLHRVLAVDANIRARFLREAKAASRIRHPHVVDVSDVGTCDNVPYLVMELLEGEDLRALFTRDETLEPEALIGLMLPVLAALRAVHEDGIVHRDLKPENIFLARTRDRAVAPKLLDFGISKLSSADHAPGITASSSMLGTPFYMAPEQATDARNVDARADLYAVGVILYEGLAGAVPYRGDNLFAVLTAASRGDCAPLRSSRASIPEALEAAVLRAMAVVPSDRFADVPAMACALLPFASHASRARWSEVFAMDAAPAQSPPDAPHVAAVTPVLRGTLSATSQSIERVAPPGVGVGRRARWVVGAAAVATTVLLGGFTLWSRNDDAVTSWPPPRIGASARPAVARVETRTRQDTPLAPTAPADAGSLAPVAPVAPTPTAVVTASAHPPGGRRRHLPTRTLPVPTSPTPSVTPMNEAPIVD